MTQKKTQTALVTGASSGIGYELSILLAENNFNLVIVARSKDKLDSLKKEIKRKHKVNVFPVGMDLALPDSSKELLHILNGESIQITHLINNAGVGDLCAFETSDWKKLDQMISLNMRTLTQLTYLFLPQLKKSKSACVLNVSSIAAFLPGPNMAVYYASKAYVQSFSEALAEELAEHDIDVIALCPGPTQSGFQEAASISSSNPLFKGVPSSKEVAKYAIKLINKGSRVGVHGFKNKVMVFSLRFLPRRAITKLMSKLQSSRKKQLSFEIGG